MDHASSSAEHPEEQYVPPLSADEMVALATSLPAHPHWGPSLRKKNPWFVRWHKFLIVKYCRRYTKERILDVEGEVRAACEHLKLPDACASGLTLALLPLCASPKGDDELEVLCDDADNEAVSAFYAALEPPTCTVKWLTIRGAAFGTRVAAARLGRYLNVNSTI